MTLTRAIQTAALAVALSTAALLPGCSKPDQRLNVVLIVIDTLRDDHCSVSGYERPTTPQLERLAADGVRLEQAYSPTSTTGPTHASLFTSLYPIAHGVVKNGLTLGEDYETLAEVLGGAGYATSGIASSFVLNPKFGYGQGFERYDASFTAEHATIERPVMDGHAVDGEIFDQRADATTAKAQEELERLAGGRQPFFLFAHYFDPHHPYVPPETWGERFGWSEGQAKTVESEIDAYDAEIAFADDRVGALLQTLDELGRRDDTLVIVTADHGEGLMQHGHMHHGVQIYEESVRVPLIFRLPGRLPAASTVEGPVELTDIFPTVLQLLEIPHTGQIHGRSLVAALDGSEPLDPERPVHLHRRHYDPQTIGEIAVDGEQFGVREGKWKYIEAEAEGRRELYDLEADPAESRNVHDEQPEVAAQLSERVAGWKLAYGREQEGQELSAEDIERLKALGYIN
jgi:arylsulfatase A-like enzyme